MASKNQPRAKLGTGPEVPKSFAGNVTPFPSLNPIGTVREKAAWSM